MKDTLTDANFPKTADQRVYHLGVRPGEVANRIVTVGSPSRAKTISSYLDAQPEPFVLSSERGFLTITGRYKGVPVSIVSIGMGAPNMDFFVREIRESVTGDLAIIRLGSCGGLGDVNPGTVVIPNASVEISRNVDYFIDPENCSDPAYRISKQVPADKDLTEELVKCLSATKPPTSTATVVSGVVNASADSFYSSQGRQTSFPDHNEGLIEHLIEKVENLATLEMETFHLFHLAACWTGRTALSSKLESPPLSTGPVTPVIAKPSSDYIQTEALPQTAGSAAKPTASAAPVDPIVPNTVIKAAAIHMVFASRKSRDFITPQQVEEAEHWAGKGVLDALVNTEIPKNRLHPSGNSVWDLV
ncbi:uridine phosphorylase [Agrocybe pediades]|nr:uridine phosphorylase [Agrocybe pediades]